MEMKNIIYEYLSEIDKTYLFIELNFCSQIRNLYLKYNTPTNENVKYYLNFTNKDICLDDICRETNALEFFLIEEKFNALLNKFKNENINFTFIDDTHKKIIISLIEKTIYQPEEIIIHLSNKSFEKKYKIENYEIIITSNITLKDILSIAIDISRFPFIIPPSIDAIINLNLENDIHGLTYAQKRNFFQRIILGRKPSEGLRFLDNCNILKFFIPELTNGKNLSQNRFHAYDIFNHSLFALDGVFKNDIHIRWASLLHDIGKVPTRKILENGEATFHNHEMYSAKMVPVIMNRLGIPKNIGKRILFLVRNHMFHYTSEWSDKAVRRFIKKVNQQDLEDLITLRLADRKGSGKKDSFPKGLIFLMSHIENLKKKENDLKVVDLKIKGNDLIAMGIKPGPIMGLLLNNLLTLVKKNELLNESDNLKEKALDFIKNQNQFELVKKNNYYE